MYNFYVCRGSLGVGFYQKKKKKRTLKLIENIRLDTPCGRWGHLVTPM